VLLDVGELTDVNIVAAPFGVNERCFFTS